jgi:isopentenyldiphosphate isomerase
MEKLQIVHGSTNEPTGLILNRAEAIANKAWCRSTNVFVLNAQGHVLCHRRSEEKERLPGVWSTHLGGHVNESETYETNALKEIEEEAGIVADKSELLAWRTSPIEHARLWVRDFVLFRDLPVHQFVPQEGEVDEFQWMHVGEIIERATKQPDIWCAGTHDFRIEYACMRAVFTTAHSLGVVELPKTLHSIHPFF